MEEQEKEQERKKENAKKPLNTSDGFATAQYQSLKFILHFPIVGKKEVPICCK